MAGQEFDEFGFLLGLRGEDNDYRSHDYTNQHQMSDSLVVERIWERLMRDWRTISASAPGKIEARLKQGVPNRMRGKLWQLMLDSEGIKAAASFQYVTELQDIEELLSSRQGRLIESDRCRLQWAQAYSKRAIEEPGTALPMFEGELPSDKLFPSEQAIKQIRLDLGRTFYTHRLFMERDGAGQRMLFNILAVYARVNPRVGYCQGMAYVAGVLLMQMPEEAAFWCLVALLESPRYLEGYYSETLDRVQHDAKVFAGLVVARHPELGQHLEDLGVHPLMYVTPWFMCAFTSLPCWDTVLSIWDLLLLKGVKVLHRAGMAIIDICKQDLLSADSLGVLLPYLQRLPPPKLRRHVLVDAVYKVEESQLNVLLAHVETTLARQTAQETSARGSRAGAKRLAQEMEGKQPLTPAAKRLKSEPSGQTPSIFRRFMNSLATPLRNRAREDGAQTPNRPEVVQKASRRSGLSPVAGTPPAPVLTVIYSPEAIPAEARTQSFATSGVLSPSFRGPISVQELTFTDLRSNVLSPRENSLLDMLSPDTFDTFKMVTPARTDMPHKKPSLSLKENTPLVQMREFVLNKESQFHPYEMELYGSNASLSPQSGTLIQETNS